MLCATPNAHAHVPSPTLFITVLALKWRSLALIITSVCVEHDEIWIVVDGERARAMKLYFVINASTNTPSPYRNATVSFVFNGTYSVEAKLCDRMNSSGNWSQDYCNTPTRCDLLKALQFIEQPPANIVLRFRNILIKSIDAHFD